MPALKRSWQPGRSTLRSGARLGSQHFPQGLEGDRPGDTGSVVSLEFHFPPDEAGALPGSQFMIGAFSQRYAEADPLGGRFQAESRIAGPVFTPAPIRNGAGNASDLLISAVAVSISLTARSTRKISAPACGGRSWTHTAMTASPMYFCAQLPWRRAICPLRRNQVPMVWESRDSGRLRASGVKSRMSTTRMVVRRLVCSAVVASFLGSTPGAVNRDAERAGLQKISCWSPNRILSLSLSATGKLTRVPLTKEPLRLPRSTSARQPASRSWIRACKRDTERLSSMTAHPSPRPMAQDCPWPRGKRRPLDSTIRNGLNAEGVTVHQFSRRLCEATAPRTCQNIRCLTERREGRSQIRCFVLERAAAAGTGGTKLALFCMSDGLNWLRRRADRLSGKILNGNLPGLHILTTAGSINHAPRFSSGCGGSQSVHQADDACRTGGGGGCLESTGSGDRRFLCLREQSSHRPLDFLLVWRAGDLEPDGDAGCRGARGGLKAGAFTGESAGRKSPQRPLEARRPPVSFARASPQGAGGSAQGDQAR